jgi:hypothetical protein
MPNAQAKRELDMVAALVDDLGETELRVAQQKARAGMLRTMISRLGIGVYSGKKYEATVAALIAKGGGTQVLLKRKP